MNTLKSFLVVGVTKMLSRGVLYGFALAISFCQIGLAAQIALPTSTHLRLEVFVRDDLEFCRTAAQQAKDFARQRGGVCVTVHDVAASEESLARFWQLARKNKTSKPGLPAFYACGQFVLGSRQDDINQRRIKALFTANVFGRHDCPRCQGAKTFLASLQKRWPGIRMEFLDVIADRAAKEQMEEAARRYGKTVTGLPLIVFGGRAIVGYQGDAITGRQLEDILRSAEKCPKPAADRSHAAAISKWELARGDSPVDVRLNYVSAEADDALPLPPPGESSEDDAFPVDPRADDAAAPDNSAQIELPWLGVVRVSDWGLPLFTLIVGLVDGFNPCAMWVLVFLLSVLVNVKDRLKIFAIAGTFVIISGLAYFAFMAAWLNVFLLFGMARPLQIALGCVAVFIGAVNVKDFLAFKRGLTLSIPESAKPGIYARVRRIVATDYLPLAIGLAVVLAIAVNMVELLCTAGLPALYTEILALQSLSAWKTYAYLGLYNLAYMFDDSLLLATFIITLSHRKLQEREGRWLKLLSGVVILAIGVVMLFRPDWLHAGTG